MALASLGAYGKYPRPTLRIEESPASVMPEPQDEFDPPFEALEPADCRGPLLFNSPHSGRVYPREFLLTSRLDLATLRRSEDSFVGS